MVILLEEVSWESNGDGVTSRTIWVSILLEVFVGCLVGQNLCHTKHVKHNWLTFGEVSCTYVVGFGESDELLDGEWVVWVLVRMHLKGKLSVRFLDFSHSGIGGNSKDLKWIERLECLNGHDHLEVLPPDVPEEGSHDDLEVE